MFPTLLSKQDLEASESGILHQPDTGQVEASSVARLQPLHAGHAGRGPGQLPTHGQHFWSDGKYIATLHESHTSLKSTAFLLPWKWAPAGFALTLKVFKSLGEIGYAFESLWKLSEVCESLWKLSGVCESLWKLSGVCENWVGSVKVCENWVGSVKVGELCGLQSAGKKLVFCFNLLREITKNSLPISFDW